MKKGEKRKEKGRGKKGKGKMDMRQGQRKDERIENERKGRDEGVKGDK